MRDARDASLARTYRAREECLPRHALQGGLWVRVQGVGCRGQGKVSSDRGKSFSGGERALGSLALYIRAREASLASSTLELAV